MCCELSEGDGGLISGFTPSSHSLMLQFSLILISERVLFTV